MDNLIEIPVLRGFTEIASIYDVVYPFGGYIAGGYARYMGAPRFNSPIPGDVDIFSINTSCFESMKSYFLAPERKLEIRHENAISITFKRAEEGPFAYCPIIQLIKPMITGAIETLGPMDSVLSNFDFTVVRIGLKTPKTLLADPDFLEHEKKRLLVIRNIHCPISSLLRSLKYVRKGYYLRPAEAMKLFLDWDGRDQDYRNKLIDLFSKSAMGEITQEEIDELEALLKVD